MDKLSYALGLSMGNNFKASGIETLTVEDFTRGVQAVFEGAKPEMTYDEAKQVINEYFTHLQQELNEKNRAAGEAFLEENKKRAGRRPAATDKVQCHYHGTLIDGTVFDSSVQRGTPAVFGVNQVIAGWVEALQLMPEGSKWKLFIPSDLAYGERGAGDKIGPNAALIFEVELIKIL